MKRRVLALILFGAAMWFVATPQGALGFGGKWRNRGGDCNTSCGSGCGMSGMTAGCGVGYTVSYVDQKVTAYKAETETKDVKVMVHKWVDEKQEYKYIVMQPVTTKQKVTVQELKSKEETYKYTTMEPVTVKEKVKVTEYQLKTKDVEVVSCSYQPVVTKQKRTVCEYVCVPVQVTCVVPMYSSCGSNRGGFFSRCCRKQSGCDTGCGGCDTGCATPCGQLVTTTVMKRQMVTREVEVDVTTYKRVETKSMQKQNYYEPVVVEKEVTVTKCQPVEREGKRTVHFYTPVEKEVDVTTCKPVEMTGTRMVKRLAQVEEVVKQTFTKMVPYETTVKVPVYTPVQAAPAPCGDCCSSPCGMTGGCGSTSRVRGGLFGRCCGK
jgi:hypothetical protein